MEIQLKVIIVNTCREKDLETFHWGQLYIYTASVFVSVTETCVYKRMIKRMDGIKQYEQKTVQEVETSCTAPPIL